MILFQFLVLMAIVLGAVVFALKKIFMVDTETAIQRLGQVNQDLLKKQQDLLKKNEELDKTFQAKREEATSIIDKMKEEATGELRKKEDEVLKVARAQAEEIIAKATSSQEDMAKEIESRLSKKMIFFSTEIVKKAFHEKIIAAIHVELIQDFIRRAKDLELSGGSDTSFVIRSPIALKKEESDKITALLASKLSRVVTFSEVRDTDLVAGIVMQFGSLTLDGSLTALLRDTAEKVQEKY